MNNYVYDAIMTELEAKYYNKLDKREPVKRERIALLKTKCDCVNNENEHGFLLPNNKFINVLPSTWYLAICGSYFQGDVTVMLIEEHDFKNEVINVEIYKFIEYSDIPTKMVVNLNTTCINVMNQDTVAKQCIKKISVLASLFKMEEHTSNLIGYIEHTQRDLLARTGMVHKDVWKKIEQKHRCDVHSRLFAEEIETNTLINTYVLLQLERTVSMGKSIACQENIIGDARPNMTKHTFDIGPTNHFDLINKCFTNGEIKVKFKKQKHFKIANLIQSMKMPIDYFKIVLLELARWYHIRGEIVKILETIWRLYNIEDFQVTKKVWTEDELYEYLILTYENTWHNALNIIYYMFFKRDERSLGSLVAIYSDLEKTYGRQNIWSDLIEKADTFDLVGNETCDKTYTD